MIALLDTSQNIKQCGAELGCAVGQLLTPLTRFYLQDHAMPWAIDNGAYTKFNERAFNALLLRERERRAACLFVTLPDIVGSARRTVEVFHHWRTKMVGWRVALALQDGIEDIEIPWALVDAVFVGGSTSFKMSAQAASAIKAALLFGKWVHVGRVNDPERFAHFEALGVHSIDGSGISQYSHMRHAIRQRNETPQVKLI